MSYESDDDVEALARWWKENGRSVIAGVVIAIAGLIGWHQWRDYQETRAVRASEDYAAFLTEIQKPDAGEGAIQRGQALIDNYGSTTYGPLTAFWLAHYHVGHNQLDKAEAQLRWAVQNPGSEAVKRVAQLRLARVLLAEGKHDDALAALQPLPTGAFAAEYNELRGDILAAQGKREDAIAAYRSALADKEGAAPRRGLIELKLNDLGASLEPVS